MEADITEKLTIWRQKATAGTLSLSEMREAIQYLRQNRTMATEAAKKKGTSKKVVNSQDLLNELEGL
jgi:hypothetical protein